MKYNIVIDNIHRKMTSGSLSDVVEHIDYTLFVTASKDGNNHYIQRHYNCYLENSVTAENFVEYSSLNVGLVNSWITGSFDWNNITLSEAERHVSRSVWPENYVLQSSDGLPW